MTQKDWSEDKRYAVSHSLSLHASSILRHYSFCLLASSTPLCLRVPSKKISSDSTYILISITKRTVQPAVKDKSGLAGLYDRMQHQSKPASAPLAQEEEESLQGTDHVGSPRATFHY